jgi:hypothetical protein
MMRITSISRLPLFASDAGGGSGGGSGGGADGGQGAGGSSQGGGGADGQGGGSGTGGQGGGDTWWSKAEGLDAETSAFLKAKNYPDLNTALRSGREADHAARARFPDPAKIGEWDGWDKLGWTPDAAQYKVAIPDDVKKDFPDFDAELETNFVKFAHGAKMPAHLAQGVMDFFVGHAKGLETAIKERGVKSATEMDAALRKEWGAAYDGNVELAKRAFQTLEVNVDDATALEKLSGSPGLVKLFHKFAGMMGEDRLVAPGGAGGGRQATTAAEAQAELDRLNRDPEHRKAVGNPAHPDYRKANDERARLAALISGGK